MSEPAREAALLRRSAEGLAGSLPPLLIAAEQLAMTVQLGEHGRRRAGIGDEFWQFRPAHAGDGARAIDWRRSARADMHFVREKEWQAAQSLHLWVDDARSMDFAGAPGHPTKAERARVLALALAVLAIRSGERAGLASTALPPRGGEVQLARLTNALSAPSDGTDYGDPSTPVLLPHSRALFVSDFLGAVDGVEKALAEAAARGVRGVLLQVLDPSEEVLPFDGRTIFESMGGTLRHDTLKAGDLRGRYQARLAARRERLAALAAAAGWRFSTHLTSSAAQSALLWLYHAFEVARR